MGAMETVNMNLGDRLDPLVAALSRLCDEGFSSEEETEVARLVVARAGLFSIPKLEALLDLAIAAKERIYITDIPMLLAELGIKEGKLPDGTVVGKETIYSVKQINKESVAAWLIANGYGSSIKDNLAFERGQYSEEIDRFLVESGASFSRSQDVHAQTLKKVVKEHIEAGLPPPPKEAIEVGVIERGVVKAPKKKGF